MGIGGGITLIVLGLILTMGVIQVDIPFVNEYALGVILILGGIAAVILALTIWRDRGLGGTECSAAVEVGLSNARLSNATLMAR